MIKLYNTLNRKKEKFEPIEKGKVGIYSCGPTVYWYQHIGNIRAYINWDVLKRVLLFNGLDVKHVINVTDVGHLTSDEDEGDDKIEKAALKENKKAEEIAKHYYDAFVSDLNKMNIIEPNIWSWATKHIKEQIELVSLLEGKGFTYKTSDGIYFNTSKFKDYGKLSRKNIEGLKAGERVDFKEKKNKTDFALWKFSENPGERQQEWDSPWGIGFPGWHIECSAMASKYLGKQFDIHTGGIDHIPIHHENEIAQSECGFGVKPWVKIWMHNAFLNFKGGKMSKSSGNILKVSDLEEKGVEPLAYRYFILTAHYRSPIKFDMKSLEGLKNAQTAYHKIKNLISELKNDDEENEEYLKDFTEAVNDDLNMPKALAVLWKLLRDEKAIGKLKTIKKMDEIFGLDLLKKENVKIPKEIKKLAEERLVARNAKDWEKSDELRDILKKSGWGIKDNSKGFHLIKLG